MGRPAGVGSARAEEAECMGAAAAASGKAGVGREVREARDAEWALKDLASS